MPKEGELNQLPRETFAAPEQMLRPGDIAGLDTFNVRNEMGQRINGFVVDNPANDTLVLYMHGSIGNIYSRHFLPNYRLFLNWGYDLAAFDYRGYGLSEGELNIPRFHLDLRAVKTYLEERLGSTHVVLYGQSLGTSAIVPYAVHHGCDRAVLVGSSFDPRTIAEYKLQQMFFVKRWFADYFVEPGLRFNTLEEFRQLRCPVLMLHGQNDELTPYGLSKRYFEAIGSAHKRYVDSPHVGHVDFLEEDPELFRRELQQFIRASF